VIEGVGRENSGDWGSKKKLGDDGRDQVDLSGGPDLARPIKAEGGQCVAKNCTETGKQGRGIKKGHIGTEKEGSDVGKVTG